METNKKETTSLPETLRNTIIGSCCVAFGQLLFATNDTMVKFSGLKESQLLSGRYFVQFGIAIFWWLLNKPNNSTNWYGDKPYITNIWLRGLMYTISMLTGYYAFITLPIGDATTIYYQSPIVIAIIAWFFLNEKLPKVTPIIVTLGVTGILFISQPSFLIKIYTKLIYDDSNIINNSDAAILETQHMEPLRIDGVLSMIVTLITWSISVVLVRKAKEAHFLQLEIASAAQLLFIAIPLLMIFNEFVFHIKIIGGLAITEWSFDIKSIIILLLIGTLGFIGLALNVVGFQYGDATKVAWLEYIIIIFGYLYQTFVFQDSPNTFEIIGIFLVAIACCLSLCEDIYCHYVNKRNNVMPYQQIDNVTSDAILDSEVENQSLIPL